jgi:holin-like protein
MIGYLTVILACQLVGELAAAATGLPLPGPVIGLVLLFVGLLIKRGIPEDLGRVGDALLSNLSLLFVPAGVGVMLHAGLLGADWLPISAAVLVSTLLTIAVTAGVMVWLKPSAKQEPDK